MPFRRWLPQVLLALVGCAVLATFPLGSVAEASPCTPLSVVLSKIEGDTRLVEMRVLTGKKLKLAIEVFTSLSQQEIPWSAAYLAVRNDGHSILVMGFDNRVCVGAVFDPNQTRHFLNELYGVAA